MAIRGDTTAGAQAAHSVSMHLPTDTPEAPTGSDTKSTAISTAIKAMGEAWKTEVGTFNTSVDQLRQGIKDAADRITAADQQGAATVNQSGGTRYV